MRIPDQLGVTCADPQCRSAAEVGAWCPAHALTRYRVAAVRPTPDRWLGKHPEIPECSFDGCRRFATSEDALCFAHRKQLAKRGRLARIAVRRKNGAALERDELGRKECGMCTEWLPLDAYPASPVQADGLASTCNHCRVFDTYGVTPTRHAEMLEAQRHVCAICAEPDPAGKRLAVDHDHKCCRNARSCGKCVRGLLCGRCNPGIGYFRDDADRLRSAADYVDWWAAQQPRRVPERPTRIAASDEKRWYQFRVTADNYTATLAAQGGTCALCPRTPSVGRSFAVDHDHSCCPEKGKSCGRCVRGLLCTRCNVGLGYFRDSSTRLRAAADYVAHHAARATPAAA